MAAGVLSVHVKDSPGDVAPGDRTGFGQAVAGVTLKVTLPELP